LAKRLINVAIAAGCDAVKFQKRTVDVVYTSAELAKVRESPFGTTNGELKRALEFGKEQYREIDATARRRNCVVCVPLDEASVDFLESFNVPCHKVASASLTDDNLLRTFVRRKSRSLSRPA